MLHGNSRRYYEEFASPGWRGGGGGAVTDLSKHGDKDPVQVAKMKRERERERDEKEKKAEKRAVVKLKAKAEIETRFPPVPSSTSSRRPKRFQVGHYRSLTVKCLSFAEQRHG